MGPAAIALASQAGKAIDSAAQPLSEQAGYWIGEATGYNERLRQDQLQQEQALTEIQQNANFQTMDKQHQLQTDMFDYTFAKQNAYNSPAEQIARYKAAGMNPGLMYSNGKAEAAGGTTGNAGAPSAGKGNASDEASRRQNSIQAQGMAMQLKKLASEIDVNKSVAEVNRASAGKQGAETSTIERTRDILVEKLKEEGLAKVIENARNQYEIGDKRQDFADVLGGVIDIKDNSLFAKKLAAAVLESFAETNNLNAQAALSNERGKILWQELYVAQQNADSKEIEAKAKQLAIEFGTGEYTNWKTWVELAKDGVELTTDVIGKVKNPVKTIITKKQ